MTTCHGDFIDPHTVYPGDFCCEKLDGDQVNILKKTGLADAVLSATTPDDFPALTYYAEHPSDKTALLMLFPIGNVTRANLFVYRDMKDPWLSQLRAAPQETLAIGDAAFAIQQFESRLAILERPLG